MPKQWRMGYSSPRSTRLSNSSTQSVALPRLSTWCRTPARISSLIKTLAPPASGTARSRCSTCWGSFRSEEEMRIFTVCQKVKVCRRRTHRFPPRGAPHGLQQSLLQRMEHGGASRFSINRYSGATQHAALLWHAPATPREVTVRPSTHLDVNNGIPQNEACWQRYVRRWTSRAVRVLGTLVGNSF